MKFTAEHEWLRADGDNVIVGVTQYAADQMGDIVFVELPEAGADISKGAEIVVIESVKVASDILAPLDGTIVEVNSALGDTPDLVNSDPLGAGWFFKMKPSDPSQMADLMDEAEYNTLIA